MASYYYPAVFTEDNGLYAVEFPDIEGCYTCGDDVQDALEMAKDALSLMLVDIEDNKQSIPTPSDIRNIKVGDGAFTTIIQCDTEKCRKTLKSKAVKKTLSIPEWLNDAAMAAGINFSQVLQEALKERLSIQ